LHKNPLSIKHLLAPLNWCATSSLPRQTDFAYYNNVGFFEQEEVEEFNEEIKERISARS